jgi:ubiquinone/menaquinone biosynthesis C-methylase UbiE
MSEQNLISERDYNALPRFFTIKNDKDSWLYLVEQVKKNPERAQEILMRGIRDAVTKVQAQNTAEYMRRAQNV